MASWASGAAARIVCRIRPRTARFSGGKPAMYSSMLSGFACPVSMPYPSPVCRVTHPPHRPLQRPGVVLAVEELVQQAGERRISFRPSRVDPILGYTLQDRVGQRRFLPALRVLAHPDDHHVAGRDDVDPLLE